MLKTSYSFDMIWVIEITIEIEKKDYADLNYINLKYSKICIDARQKV